MTTMMRASGSAEFLGMIPLLAGFTPTRSIVLVPFEERRAYGVMRIDLPPDVDAVAFAPEAIGLLARVKRADAVAIVVYTDETATRTADGLVLPHSVLTDLLAVTIEDADLSLIDALCVTAEGWASYIDTEPRLEPLPAVPGATEDVAAVSGDQDEGSELEAIDLAEKERIGQAVATVHEALIAAAERPGSEGQEVFEMFDDIPALAELFLREPDGRPPIETAVMLWLLERPLLRDAVLVQWATTFAQGDAVLATQIASGLGWASADPEHGRMLVGEGTRPDPDRLRAAVRAARVLAARAPRSLRKGPLAVAAWLSWAAGRSSHAARHLEQLHAIDPDYPFAQLITKLLITRPIPEWAFERPAT